MAFNIKVNNRIAFKKCKSEVQQCVHCGKIIGRGIVGLILRNKGEGIALKKNLWLHTICIDEFGDTLKRELIVNKDAIVAEGI